MTIVNYYSDDLIAIVGRSSIVLLTYLLTVWRNKGLHYYLYTTRTSFLTSATYTHRSPQTIAWKRCFIHSFSHSFIIRIIGIR